MKSCISTLLLLSGMICFGQDIQIKDIQFSQGYQFSKLSEENFRFIYRIKGRDLNQSAFRKIDFNDRLEMLDTTLIRLQGNYQLISTTTSKTHTVSVFGTGVTASLVIHFIDNQTEDQLFYPLQIMGFWKKKNPIQLHSSPSSNAIYLLYKIDKRNWELQQIDLRGKPIWSKRFTDTKKIYVGNIHLIDGTKLALVRIKHAGSRKAENEVLVIDGNTGNEVYTHQLFSEDSKSTVDNLIYSDSILYLAGRTFFKNRVSNQTTGLPYLRQFDSNNASDIKLTSSLMNLKTYWMDVVTTNTGERYLIGETFTNEPYGAYFMKGVATGLMTLGLFYVSWTSMKFQQVAVVPLDNPNAPPLTLVPLTPRRIQLGTYLPGYPFATYSYNTGQVRYWGHDNKESVVLMNGGSLKRYNLLSKTSEDLGLLPGNSSQIVIHTSEDYLIYLNQRKVNNLIEFKVLPLTK
jgi:hypothetical protein